jgi:hypothetical protein
MQATASSHTQLHVSNYRSYFLLFIPFHNDQFSLPCVDRHIYALLPKCRNSLHSLRSCHLTKPLTSILSSFKLVLWIINSNDRVSAELTTMKRRLCFCSTSCVSVLNKDLHTKCCLAVMLIVKHHHNIQHPGSFERLYKVQK